MPLQSRTTLRTVPARRQRPRTELGDGGVRESRQRLGPEASAARRAPGPEHLAWGTLIGPLSARDAHTLGGRGPSWGDGDLAAPPWAVPVGAEGGFYENVKRASPFSKCWLERVFRGLQLHRAFLEDPSSVAT